MGNYGGRQYPARKKKPAPSMLDALLKQQAREVKKRTEPPKPRAAPTPAEWECCTCGERFVTEAACERHTTLVKHLRIGQVLAFTRPVV